jgi:large conductance mechanosensitive channel
MLKDFKAFVMRGNVLDLAVAVVIGAAFGKIVTSFVDDLLMPPLGLLLGHVDFRELFLDLSGRGHATLAAAEAAGAPVLRYGLFLNHVVNFVLVAFAVFLLVRQVARLMPKPEAKGEPAMRACPLCLSVIPSAARRCAHCTADLPAAA